MTQTSRTLCGNCEKPTNGVVLCSGCRRTTRHAIGNVAVYHDDLDTLRSGQTRYGTSAKGSTGNTRPLGMDIRFAPGGRGTKVQLAVRASVKAWATAVMVISADQPGHDSVRSVCAYLDDSLELIVKQDWAPGFMADMLSLERTLANLVDRPPEEWYAGECGKVLDADGAFCTKVLYAKPTEAFVRCANCRTEWPVKERREILVREAEDRQATVRMLARVITTLGASDASEAKLESRINTWVNRKRLHAMGSRVVDGKVRATYRVGDVLELLSKDIGTETTKRESRRATRPTETTERAS